MQKRPISNSTHSESNNLLLGSSWNPQFRKCFLNILLKRFGAFPKFLWKFRVSFMVKSKVLYLRQKRCQKVFKELGFITTLFLPSIPAPKCPLWGLGRGKPRRRRSARPWNMPCSPAATVTLTAPLFTGMRKKSENFDDLQEISQNNPYEPRIII